MTTRVAINGFGRIGRGVVRAAIERQADIQIVAVNDVADVDTLAHLLAFDSVYGRFPAMVAVRDGVIKIGDKGSSPPPTAILPISRGTPSASRAARPRRPAR